MNRIGKKILYGVLIWLICFALGVLAWPLHESQFLLFKTIMVVGGTLISMIFIHLNIKESPMRTLSISMVLIALSIFIVSCQHGRPNLTESDKSKIEKEILSVNAEMIRSAEQADLDKMFDYLIDHDGGVVIRNGQLILSRAEAYEQYQRDFQGIERLTYQLEHQYVTVLSEDAALLTMNGISNFTTTDGRTFSAPFAQTNVLVKQDGEWKVLHVHASTRANKK